MPLTGDGARHGDPRLVVERPAEAHGVDHDVRHAVVVVQADLVGVDLLDRCRLRGEHQRQIVGGEPRFDARCVERHLTILGRGGELVAPFGRFVRGWIHHRVVLVVTTLIPALEQLDVVGNRQRVTLGAARRVHHAVGLERDQRVGVGGRARPIGSPLASTPASLPSFSGECTHTPTSSRSGRCWMARMAIDPIRPWTTPRRGADLLSSHPPRSSVKRSGLAGLLEVAVWVVDLHGRIGPQVVGGLRITADPQQAEHRDRK